MHIHIRHIYIYTKQSIIIIAMVLKSALNGQN